MKTLTASDETDFSELTKPRSSREVIIKQRSHRHTKYSTFIFMLKICRTARCESWDTFNDLQHGWEHEAPLTELDDRLHWNEILTRCLWKTFCFSLESSRKFSHPVLNIVSHRDRLEKKKMPGMNFFFLILLTIWLELDGSNWKTIKQSCTLITDVYELLVPARHWLAFEPWIIKLNMSQPKSKGK